jgi:hypothetical protein
LDSLRANFWKGLKSEICTSMNSKLQYDRRPNEIEKCAHDISAVGPRRPAISSMAAPQQYIGRRPSDRGPDLQQYPRLRARPADGIVEEPLAEDSEPGSPTQTRRPLGPRSPTRNRRSVTRKLTASGVSGKVCWICLEGETESSSSRFIHACSCSLFAHERCLLDWIAESQKRSRSSYLDEQKPVSCPQCKQVYTLYQQHSPILEFLQRMDRYYARLALRLTLGAAGMPLLVVS